MSDLLNSTVTDHCWSVRTHYAGDRHETHLAAWLTAMEQSFEAVQRHTDHYAAYPNSITDEGLDNVARVTIEERVVFTYADGSGGTERPIDREVVTCRNAEHVERYNRILAQRELRTERSGS